MTELVEPILRGIAHPHTALTEEQLAEVRADLELAEPKKCTLRYINRVTGEHTEECGRLAVVDELWACGRSTYACDQHEASSLAIINCRQCGQRCRPEQHLVAVVPL